MDILKIVYNDMELSEKKFNSKKIQIPALVGASMSCKELKATIHTGLYIFVGEKSAVNKLINKCAECGIQI